jgi:hypothetical protein
MTRVKLADGKLRDEVRQPMYDTIVILGGQSPIGIHTFFSAVQGKSINATNLRQNNMMESGVSYRVQGMGLDAQNLNVQNIDVLSLIMKASGLKFRIGEKVYFTANLNQVCGRVDTVMSACPGSNATVVEKAFGHLGAPSVAQIAFKGQYAIDIAPLQSFAVDMEVSSDATFGLSGGLVARATPAANTKVEFTLSLKGLMRRPVQ